MTSCGCSAKRFATSYKKNSRRTKPTSASSIARCRSLDRSRCGRHAGGSLLNSRLTSGMMVVSRFHHSTIGVPWQIRNLLLLLSWEWRDHTPLQEAQAYTYHKSSHLAVRSPCPPDFVTMQFPVCMMCAFTDCHDAAKDSLATPNPALCMAKR